MLREREREEKKERSFHRNYLHISGYLGYVLRHVPQAPKALIVKVTRI
jgi:hypothetical protein